MTALVPQRGGRVRVDLDGAPWRVVPASVAARAAVAVGSELDRPGARRLGRELRRASALASATRLLAARDRPSADLEARLAQQGVRRRDRRQAIESLERAGYLDDERFAANRAAALAAQDRGDGAIAVDLERRGIARDAVRAALASLEPEAQRAAAIAARDGATARTARRLLSRGFGEDAVESAVGHSAWNDSGDGVL